MKSQDLQKLDAHWDYEPGRDAFHRVPFFRAEVTDAVERVPTGFMKSFSRNSCVTFLLGVALGTAVCATRADMFSFSGLNKDIPDADLSGTVDVQQVNGVQGLILDLNVALTIESTGWGAFNGDLYITLQHGSGLSVLLNRLGRTATDAIGYGDPGVQVTLDDEAAQDIHLYRGLNGPLNSPLTGTWQPDARFVLPFDVVETSARTAFLDVFDGLDPNGEWTLFLADLETGGTANLEQWALEIETVRVPVPEVIPTSIILTPLFAICVLHALSRRRMT